MINLFSRQGNGLILKNIMAGNKKLVFYDKVKINELISLHPVSFTEEKWNHIEKMLCFVYREITLVLFILVLMMNYSFSICHVCKLTPPTSYLKKTCASPKDRKVTISQNPTEKKIHLVWFVVPRPKNSPVLVRRVFHLFHSLQNVLNDKKFLKKIKYKNGCEKFLELKIIYFYLRGINKLPSE